MAPLVLGVGLAALLGSLAFLARLPPVLGYAMAGILVGPHTPGPVLDAVLAAEVVWVGAALLLFRAGVGEVPGVLGRSRSHAFPGAVLQSLGLIAVGWSLCRIAGWDTTASLVGGLALAAPGALLSPRLFIARGLPGMLVGGAVASWLVVGGLVVVLGLAALASLTGETGEAPAAEALGAILAAAGVALAAIVAGRHLLPRLMAIGERSGAPDLPAIVPPAIGLGIVAFGSAVAGIPVVVGAFLGGLAFAATEAAWRSVRWLPAMREVFAALLVVSVGAMFDPSSISGHGLAVATAAVVVICARPVVAWLSARAVGYGREAARLLAIGAGQPGEFSLLVVTLGAAAGLLTAEHRDLFLVALLIAATAWALLLARAAPPAPDLA